MADLPVAADTTYRVTARIVFTADELLAWLGSLTPSGKAARLSRMRREYRRRRR